MGLSDIGRLLVPPKNGTATTGVTQWRWVIAVAVMLLLFNSAAGRGYLGGIGAYAAEQNVQTILELTLAKELRELQKQMCEMELRSRSTLEGVIENYQTQYMDITGRRYPLVACPTKHP